MGPHDRLASWASDLGVLHDLTDRLGCTLTLGDAAREVLRAGARLLGAPRALLALRPADGLGPHRLTGLGLSHAQLGHLETVPPESAPHTRLLAESRRGEPCWSQGHGENSQGRAGHARAGDERAGYASGGGEPPVEIVHPDIARDERLHPRHREVAAHLGYAASYAVPLTAPPAGRLGAAVWLYDHPAAPDPRQRLLLTRYLRQAARHLAYRVELGRAHAAAGAVREALLPGSFRPLTGTTVAVRHLPTPRAERGAGCDSCVFYDALQLPDGALGLAIGSTPGPGPATTATAGALRTGLRAYAVMEGEDPVAVLSDLELLLRLTEPTRAATVLFGYAEPPPGPSAARRLVLASAGHPPPLVVGPRRVAFAETALSAPLGILPCWEAPSVRLDIDHGETVLLYSVGLLNATGRPRDEAFARLEAAAHAAPPVVRADPEALADHLIRAMLAPGCLAGSPARAEDPVLLAVRFAARPS